MQKEKGSKVEGEVAEAWRGFEGWECLAMEYCRRRGKGDRGIEWQEPGVVLKDGSVESVGHLGWESSQREQSKIGRAHV